MKKKILPLLLSAFMLLPVFSLREKDTALAEDVTPVTEPTTYSSVIYTQSVSAEFTNCYFDTDGDFYQTYAQKAEIAEYEQTLETEKVFYYDLAE